MGGRVERRCARRGRSEVVVAELSAVRASPAEEGAQHGLEQVGDGDPLAVRAMGGEQACSQRFFQADST